jgi:IPT/TIG domain
MSLGKRHIGRRVAGVGVGVALMVLGLEAPAMAAPAVTSFTPTTGPANCVIALTGTGFLDVPQAQQDVVFEGPVAGASDDIVLDGGTAAADLFARISSTEMWVQIPDGVVDLGTIDTLTPGVGYTIRVDGGGTGTPSTTTFTQVTSPGGCAPTITSIAPTCGNTDTTVVITGTNLIAPGLVGATVKFAPYVKTAAHSVPDVDLTTSLSVVVPSASSDGKVQVTTFSTSGGTVFSPTVFDISDACAPVTGNEHARSISFKIKSTGKASGKVSSTEDPAFTDCVAAVPVKIQRKTSSGWKTVGKTTTTDTGSYTKKVKNPKGKQKFRALAPKVSLGDPVTDVCLKAKSAVRKV